MIGIGYVGLPTAAMFASKGHKVIGYDLNQKAVDALKKKIIEYQNVYPQVKDNVMILSLVALDYANEFLKAKRAEKKNPNGMALKSINDMVLDALK